MKAKMGAVSDCRGRTRTSCALFRFHSFPISAGQCRSVVPNALVSRTVVPNTVTPNAFAYRWVDVQSLANMKTESNQLFSKEGYDLMAAAFAVHDELGGGLAEEIYQESLELELSDRGIPFRSKQELAVFYKGRELKKRYIPDLYAFDGIVVELKSVSTLAPEHEAQLINYMRIAKMRVGYLINFGLIKGVEWKRFVI